MFDLKTFDVQKFDEILSRGLCRGIGSPDNQMCIEAAICNTLGLSHSDDPKCVAKSVREFKITLNDSNWSSNKARAEGLRDLGLAQLGSLGVVDDKEFSTRLASETIKQIIPKLFRKIFTKDTDLHKKCIEAANLCEKEPTYTIITNAAKAANAANAANAAYAANAAANAYSANAASFAANAYTTTTNNEFLLLSAKIALDILKELKSPGCELLNPA